MLQTQPGLYNRDITGTETTGTNEYNKYKFTCKNISILKNIASTAKHSKYQILYFFEKLSRLHLFLHCSK